MLTTERILSGNGLPEISNVKVAQVVEHHSDMVWMHWQLQMMAAVMMISVIKPTRVTIVVDD